MNQFCIIALLLWCCATPLLAYDTTLIEETQSQTLLTQELAFLGLTEEDAQKYHEIMQTTPAGQWYAKLNAVEVLGIMAQTEDERKRYALLAAKGAYERVDRELKFMHAYKDAYKILYPNAKVIDRKKLNTSNNPNIPRELSWQE